MVSEELCSCGHPRRNHGGSTCYACQKQGRSHHAEPFSIHKKFCNTCSGPLNEDSVFCPSCGTKIETPGELDCPSCGERNAVDSSYCDKCGTHILKTDSGISAASQNQDIDFKSSFSKLTYGKDSPNFIEEPRDEITPEVQPMPQESTITNTPFQTLPDGSGYKVEEQSTGGFCPICGSKLPVNSNFCASCGKNVNPVSSIDQVEWNAPNEPKTMTSKARGWLSSFIIGLVGFVVGIIAAVIVLSLLGIWHGAYQGFFMLLGGIGGAIVFNNYKDYVRYL